MFLSLGAIAKRTCGFGLMPRMISCQLSPPSVDRMTRFSEITKTVLSQAKSGEVTTWVIVSCGECAAPVRS